MAYKHFVTSLLIAATVSSCSHVLQPPVAEAPKIITETQSTKLLKALPPPNAKTVVTVYDFQDLTGQLKPNDNFAEYSRAVTQGGLSLINKALLQAGNGSWFTVVERGGLRDLLQERQIIRTMREQYTTPEGERLGNLPPLLYAGMLIEGGVVGYDSNIVTGGAGAKYLGVGGDVKYRRDIVTVDLRAVSIATGEVLLSVSSEKTIYSTAVNGSIFRFVSLNHLLEVEAGFTLNEPPQLAVRQAIETAVYSLIMEGARKQLWGFSNPQTGHAALQNYIQQTEGSFIVAPQDATGSPPTLQPVPSQASEKKTAAPQIEKKNIFDDISDFLSFGEDSGSPKYQPVPQYPPVPLPPKSAH